MLPIQIQEFAQEDAQETGKNPGHLKSAASHIELHYPHQNWNRDYHNQQQQHPHSPKDSSHYVIWLDQIQHPHYCCLCKESLIIRIKYIS